MSESILTPNAFRGAVPFTGKVRLAVEEVGQRAAKHPRPAPRQARTNRGFDDLGSNEIAWMGWVVACNATLFNST